MTHPSSLSLESFPTELVQAILSYASDAVSLRALILSGASLYRAFLAVQNLILKDVVRNEFRASILPHALAILTSAHFSLQRDDQIQSDQIEDSLLHFHHVAALPETWSLSESLALSTVRDYVKYFATDFASALSANLLMGVSDEGPIALTRHEMNRIERALYRYELYCNLFGKNNTQCRFDFHDQRRLFFGKFAPWENGQPATIYEYLFQQLSTGMAPQCV